MAPHARLSRRRLPLALAAAVRPRLPARAKSPAAQPGAALPRRRGAGDRRARRPARGAPGVDRARARRRGLRRAPVGDVDRAGAAAPARVRARGARLPPRRRGAGRGVGCGERRPSPEDGAAGGGAHRARRSGRRADPGPAPEPLLRPARRRLQRPRRRARPRGGGGARLGFGGGRLHHRLGANRRPPPDAHAPIRRFAAAAAALAPARRSVRLCRSRSRARAGSSGGARRRRFARLAAACLGARDPRRRRHHRAHVGRSSSASTAPLCQALALRRVELARARRERSTSSRARPPAGRRPQFNAGKGAVFNYAEATSSTRRSWTAPRSAAARSPA